MSSLNLNQISKVYLSGETALYDVSLEAEDREFLVIVGGEKCGKTSLLKVIAGLEEATSGVISIDGKDVTDVEPKDRNIAMIFRNDTLYPSLSVYDNMAYGLRLRRAPQALIDERVKAAANILGLTDMLYRKPKALTAAARQRVAMGRAICREPRLYLLDEPLAGIDENLRRDMLSVIINLQARMKGTFIYATKNLSEALTIGTRLVVLKKGLVQQIDTPANLYDYPANTYVAFFIGSPTVNFIQKAQIIKDGEGYAAQFTGGTIALPQSIADRFEKLADYAGSGKHVILGIRPEDVTVGGGLAAKYVKWEDGYAEFDMAGTNVTAACAEALEDGKEATLKVDAARLMIFDSVTRLTLLSRDGGYQNTGRADADFVPRPYPEELEILEKLRPQKSAKSKDGRKGK